CDEATLWIITVAHDDDQGMTPGLWTAPKITHRLKICKYMMVGAQAASRTRMNLKADLSNHFNFECLCFRVTALCFECLSIGR
ncbi:hypothetical protein Avbf_01740, partial [Armadillidium vulgare]